MVVYSFHILRHYSRRKVLVLGFVAGSFCVLFFGRRITENRFEQRTDKGGFVCEENVDRDIMKNIGFGTGSYYELIM
jgi:hypothetical protein